jgi:hypothetical protein
MESLQLQNQIYTIGYVIVCAICNIPYIAYWIIGFTFNMYWLLCMFNIVYTSNIYNDALNNKYFGCLTVIVPQICYLYGVLTWNPLIIGIMMYHSSIISNNISEVFWALCRSKYNLTYSDEPVAPEEDEPVAPEEDEPVAPEEDEPVAPEEDEPVAPEEDEPVAPEDTPVVISVTEEQHVD